MKKATTAWQLGAMLLALLTMGSICGGSEDDLTTLNCVCNTPDGMRAPGTHVASAKECADYDARHEVFSECIAVAIEPKRDGIVGPSAALPVSIEPTTRRWLDA